MLKSNFLIHLKTTPLIIVLFVAGCNNSKSSSSVDANTPSDKNEAGNTTNPNQSEKDSSGGDTPPITGDQPSTQQSDESTKVISGVAGTVAITSDSNGLSVTAYQITPEGDRGDPLGTGAIGENGNFSVSIPKGIGTLELAITSEGFGLTESSLPNLRTRIQLDEKSHFVAINALTELSVSRSLKISSEKSLSWSEALVRARAETTALSGVTDIFDAPADLGKSQLPSDANAKATLYLEGLARVAEAKGIPTTEFFSKFKDDFLDGTIDSKSGDQSILLGDKNLFNERPNDSTTGYSGEFRAAMKDFVRNSQQTAADFNTIPALNSYAKSTIESLAPENLANYEASNNTYYERWIEFVKSDNSSPSKADTIFADKTDCLGPFKLARRNRFGRLLSQDKDNKDIELGLASAKFYGNASDCSTDSSPVTAITLPADHTETSDFYVRPGNYQQNTVYTYYSGGEDLKIEPSFLPLYCEISGEPCARQIGVTIVDSLASYDAGTQTEYGFDMPIPRDTCLTVVFPLYASPSDTGPNAESFTITNFKNIYDSANVSTPYGSLPDSGSAKYVPFYSDSTCSTLYGFDYHETVPQLAKRFAVYMKVPTTYNSGYPSFPNRFMPYFRILPLNYDVSPTQQYYMTVADP